jgi:hypothetical protein
MMWTEKIRMFFMMKHMEDITKQDDTLLVGPREIFIL